MKINKYLAAFCVFILLGSINAALIYYFYPLNPASKESKPLSGTILWHGNRKLPEVALTFDDGPNSKATPQILDILKQYNIKATFFVLGKFIDQNKDILIRTSKEGHIIGNHTFSHAKGTLTDIKGIKKELGQTDQLIKKYTGKDVVYFRPPFGYENWRFLMEAELLDYSVILWSLDVGDWNNKKNKEDIVNKINKIARNGTIILLHDGGANREAVISSLPAIIKGLKKKGYRFVTIDEMIAHL